MPYLLYPRRGFISGDAVRLWATDIAADKGLLDARPDETWEQACARFCERLTLPEAMQLLMDEGKATFSK